MIEMFGVTLRQMGSEERSKYDTDCLRALCEVSTNHEGLLLCLSFIDNEDKLPQRGIIMNYKYDSYEAVKLNKAYVNELTTVKGDIPKHDCWLFISVRESMTDDIRSNDRTFYVYDGMLLKEEVR